MERKNLKRLKMTNKEMMESVLDEIQAMGFHITNKRLDNTYFIIEGDDDSICHFYIKEIPGFKFALWSTSRFDSVDKQLKDNGIGWTWADSLGIDPRSDVVFFTQYIRDIDKFKPSRSGFVWGLYMDSWQEETEDGNINTVEGWRNLETLEMILHYMKKHHIRSAEYAGMQTRYIWEAKQNIISLTIQYIKDWYYELKHQYKKNQTYKRSKRAAMQFCRKIKYSSCIAVDESAYCSPSIEILLRRKPDVDLLKYAKEQVYIDDFEKKHWNEISILQYDVDVNNENITADDLEQDQKLKQRFIEYVKNLGVDVDDERIVLYKNVEELI